MDQWGIKEGALMIEGISIWQYGIVGIALLVVWQLSLIVTRLIFKSSSDKIDHIYKYTVYGKKVLDNAMKDKYSCYFKDRDEVVLLVKALDDLTVEIRKWNGKTK